MSKLYHFIGIGGIGMSGIAQLLLRSGQRVSGSDLKESPITQELKGLGAQVSIGHSPQNVKDADFVIYSSAIREDNPELREAKTRGIKLLRRAQALAHLMGSQITITVTGSHGKTTTTSLVSYLLMEAGLSPTVAIGGILRNIDANAALGGGNFFVAEADESDGSFLYYQPKYSIITNIDFEHIDYYKDFKRELNAFRKFLHRTKDDGCVFCSSDDKNLRTILADYKNRYMLFGLNDSADIYPKDIKQEGLNSEFECFCKDKSVGRFHLPLGGLHNVSNALAVIALGLELGIDRDLIRRALGNYKGTKRRLETRFVDSNYTVIDDYAHHPTEIKATLATVRNLGPGRIIAVFQPHRYTRTKLLLEEFGNCFDSADYIVITDIYPAGELPIEGINAKSIIDKIKERFAYKEIVFLSKQEIADHVLGLLKAGDIVITIGAGDIVKICDELVERIKR